MMKSIILFITLCFILPTTHAQHEVIEQAIQRVRDLRTGQFRSAIPENFTDYSYTWNSAIEKWDSTRVSETTFHFGEVGIDMLTTSEVLEFGNWKDSDWIDYYNVNLDDISELDPVARYTYAPADSFKGVFEDVYLFGTLPVATFFYRDNHDRLARVESYIDYTLIDPEDIRLLIDIQTFHYDSEGVLLSFNNEGMFGGLDSTAFEYNEEGQLVRAVHMTSYYSTAPEAFDITEFGYDDDGILQYEIISFIDEGIDLDFRDSVKYRHHSPLAYDKEFYTYDNNTEKYNLSSIQVYNNEDMEAHTLEIWQRVADSMALSQRTTTNYDDQQRIQSILTETAFGFSPLANSDLTERVYSIISSTKETEVSSHGISVYYDGSSIQIKSETHVEGVVNVFDSSGRLIDSTATAQRMSQGLGSLPIGVYFVQVLDTRGTQIHMQSILLGG